MCVIVMNWAPAVVHQNVLFTTLGRLPWVCAIARRGTRACIVTSVHQAITDWDQTCHVTNALVDHLNQMGFAILVSQSKKKHFMHTPPFFFFTKIQPLYKCSFGTNKVMHASESYWSVWFCMHIEMKDNYLFEFCGKTCYIKLQFLWQLVIMYTISLTYILSVRVFLCFRGRVFVLWLV